MAFEKSSLSPLTDRQTNLVDFFTEYCQNMRSFALKDEITVSVWTHSFTYAFLPYFLFFPSSCFQCCQVCDGLRKDTK